MTDITHTPIIPTTYTTAEIIAAAQQTPDLLQQRVNAIVSQLLDDGSYGSLLGASMFAREASPELRTKVREAVDTYLYDAVLYGWR